MRKTAGGAVLGLLMILLCACGQQATGSLPQDGDAELDAREGENVPERDAEDAVEREGAEVRPEDEGEVFESEAESEAEESLDGDSDAEESADVDSDSADGDSDPEHDEQTDSDPDGEHEGQADGDPDAEHEGEAELDEQEEGDSATTDDGLEDCVVEKRANTTIGEDCYHLELDASGNVVKYTPYPNCTTETMRCLRYTYEAGRLVRRSSDTTCSDALGVDDTMCERYEYDSQGRLSRTVISPYCEGEVEGTVTCYDDTYNEQGLRRSRAFSDCKNPSSCEVYEYDAAGNRTLVKIGTDCDGSVFNCQSYAYDDQGRITELGFDFGCDQTLDRDCQRYSRSVSEQGSRTWFTWDENCNQTIDAQDDCEEWLYDGAQRLLYSGYGCGTIKDLCFRYSYGANGRIETMMDDYDCDQKTNLRINSYTYDAQRRMTERRKTWLSSGETVVYTYSYGRCAPGAIEAIRSFREYALGVVEDRLGSRY